MLVTDDRLVREGDVYVVRGALERCPSPRRSMPSSLRGWTGSSRSIGHSSRMARSSG